MIPFNYVFMEFLWNGYFIPVCYKVLYYSSLHEKEPFCYSFPFKLFPFGRVIPVDSGLIFLKDRVNVPYESSLML